MTFRVALSGINAASAHLEVTAHNIANVNSTGFKSSRAIFADVFAKAANDLSSTATGSGANVASISQRFSQGNIDFTNNNLDMAVSGEGFFTVKGREGIAYTRAGDFSVDRDGFVVNSNFQRLQVFPVTDGGVFATGSLADLQLETTESPPKASTSGMVGVNLPANAPLPTLTEFDPLVPDSYNHATSMTVYDSLGTPHQATMYFSRFPSAADPLVPEENAWYQRLYIDGKPVNAVSANAVAAPTDDTLGGATNQAIPSLLSFDANGVLTSTTGLTDFAAFTTGTGSEDLTLNLNFLSSTQYGQEFSVNNLNNDGYTTGRMTGIDVDAKGVVSARFTNGQLQQLGKIAVAIFNNPNGLQQLGDTQWAETFASGGPRLGEAGTSNFGLIQAGALEASNVDLTAELVEMITAQRNFQANAQVIQTSDQITQTIINLR